ncbi:MAG: helix-turn-helix domain-containing protein [Anaerovoracaceae bacterium]
MDIGEKIKMCRKEIGMSAEELASIVGVSPSTIYRYENNDISNMGIDKLKAIAAALHTYAYVLLGWDTSDNINPEEMDLIRRYRKLDSYSKELVNLIIDKECERYVASPLPDAPTSKDHAENRTPDVDAALEEIKSRTSGKKAI